MKNEGEKKKRGRKPKNSVSDIKITKKTPKKRGRKPKNQNEPKTVKNTKKNNYTVEKMNESFNSQIKNENVILHLPVHSNELQNNLENEIPNEIGTSGLYDNYASFDNTTNINSDNINLPFSNNYSYTETHIDNSKNIENIKSWQVTDNSVIEHKDSWNDNITGQNINYDRFMNDNRFKNLELPSTSYNKKIDFLMKQFVDCNKRGIWPNQTPIYCFWCCHPFENQPCALPYKYLNGKFSVYGTFCCPECAASYNFNQHIDSNKKWERYSLLNQLYRKILGNQDLSIKMASPRETLEIFGGPLSIVQFRSLNENYNKKLIINYPPLISIIPQVEEVTFENEKTFRDNVFIPLDEERLADADKNLKLKRNKPLSKNKNTLESCMNLEFGK